MNMQPLPYPDWRKKAERGYLYALGLKRPPAWRDEERAETHVQRCVAYAILALLDGQPGPKETRLFRGWYFDLSKPFDRVLPRGWRWVTQHHDRLIFDVQGDVTFLCAVAEKDELVECFQAVHEFVVDGGGDARPLWRRRDGPWPVMIFEQGEEGATT